MIGLSIFLFSVGLAQVAGDRVTAPKPPLLGYLISESPFYVRPVLGAPGAVTVGAPMRLPRGATSFVGIPGQPFGIVEQAGAAESGLLALGVPEQSEVQPLPNSFSHFDRISFSPSGTVAVLYSAARGQAQVISGLPASPQVNQPVDLSAAGLPLTSLAVSDDATSVLAGVSNGSNGSIWLVTAGQAPRQLAVAGVPSAMQFLPAKLDAVVADSGWRQVSLLSSGKTAQVLAGPGQGVSMPVAVQVSTHQATAWIADSGVSGFLRVDLNSGAVTPADCPFPPSSMTQLAGRSVFLVTAENGAMAGLWAPETSNPAVWRLTTPRPRPTRVSK